MTVAVMQPYFVPYAGYFRLFAAADIVVMFDCVQFPRRGWVHRNRLLTAKGELDWFTLPIAKGPRESLICDLRFAEDARGRLDAIVNKFPILAKAREARNPWLARILDLGESSVAAYLSEMIRDLARTLGFDRDLLRSSSLSLPAHLKGQDRIISIAKRLGATRYVNLSGGRALYDPTAFSAAGLELAFLTPYGSGFESILARVLSEPITSLRAEILRETVVVP